jgi:hypothetical protein
MHYLNNFVFHFLSKCRHQNLIQWSQLNVPTNNVITDNVINFFAVIKFNLLSSFKIKNQLMST